MIVEKKQSLKAHSAAVYALAPGRNAGTLLSAGADKVVAEWDLETGTTLPFAVRVQSTVYSLLQTSNNEIIVGTGVGSMHVIDVNSRVEKRHLQLHDKGIFHLLEDQNEKRIYAACADGSVSIWKADDWSLLWHLKITSQKIRRLALNESGELLAVTCGDGRIVVFETKNHKVLYDWDAHADSSNAVAWLPNGNLITGGKDAYLKIWNAAKGFELIREVAAHNYAVYDIIVNNEEAWIATASRDKTIKIWDLDLLEKPLRIARPAYEGHVNSVNGLCWLPKEKLLCSCSDDRSIGVWEIDTHSEN